MDSLTTTLLTSAGKKAQGGGVVSIPQGVSFDGSTDYLSRSSDLVGNADSKTFTFSCWVYVPDLAALGTVLAVAINRFGVLINDNNRMQVTARNSSATIILNLETQIGSLPDNTYCHILVSCDLNDTAKRHIYIKDVQQPLTVNTYTNDNINFSLSGASAIGGLTTGSGKIKGRLSHIYLDYTYRDLSIEANRRIFYSAEGKPA